MCCRRPHAERWSCVLAAASWEALAGCHGGKVAALGPQTSPPGHGGDLSVCEVAEEVVEEVVEEVEEESSQPRPGTAPEVCWVT